MFLPVTDGLAHGKQGPPEQMLNVFWTDLSQEG